MASTYCRRRCCTSQGIVFQHELLSVTVILTKPRSGSAVCSCTGIDFSQFGRAAACYAGLPAAYWLGLALGFAHSGGVRQLALVVSVTGNAQPVHWLRQTRPPCVACQIMFTMH
mmetsp:Transcript_90886/g.208070  ORF Transcript_90886/g.208070 Transcript_90886/m.208070 type:complete len:114 (-) Transcript_90886:41-382(-)